MSREDLIARLTKARLDIQSAVGGLVRETERVERAVAKADAGEPCDELDAETLDRWRRSESARRRSFSELAEADKALGDYIGLLESIGRSAAARLIETQFMGDE